MTREEKEQIGIYVLQMARFLADGCYQQEMLLKAAHIIDEALEQEDCISRQAVIDLIIANHVELNGVNVVMYSPLYKDIEQLAPVASQSKTEALDKIRDEILRNSYEGFELGEGFRDGYNTAMVRVLNILDKYKAESE